MTTIYCGRCGGLIDNGDEDMCSTCLSTMANVAVAVPDDMADPDHWEDDRPLPEGVHFTNYPRLDHWIVNEFEVIELRQTPYNTFLVVHHFSNFEDSFWRQKGGDYTDMERARTAALHLAARMREEEAQAEREARGDDGDEN